MGLSNRALQKMESVCKRLSQRKGSEKCSKKKSWKQPQVFVFVICEDTSRQKACVGGTILTVVVKVLQTQTKVNSSIKMAQRSCYTEE